MLRPLFCTTTILSKTWIVTWLQISSVKESCFICTVGLDKRQLHAGAFVVSSCLFRATIGNVQVCHALRSMGHAKKDSFTKTVTVGQDKLRKQVPQHEAERATHMQEGTFDGNVVNHFCQAPLATVDLVCFWQSNSICDSCAIWHVGMASHQQMTTKSISRLRRPQCTRPSPSASPRSTAPR